MMKFQVILFRLMNKETSPMESRTRIQNDTYLHHVYKFLLGKILNAARLQPTEVNEFSVVEIGSAGGITKSLFPSIKTLDVRVDKDVDLVVTSTELPLNDASIDVVFGKDVFHHIPDVRAHLSEISRVLKVGGFCVYLEPNWNWFSKFFYTLIHPEPWYPRQLAWQFSSHNPMFSNQALPWIVFVRDLEIFESLFPDLELEIQECPLMGLSYLISGGVNRRSFINGKVLKKLFEAEQSKLGYLKIFGLSRIIVLRKTSFQTPI